MNKWIIDSHSHIGLDNSWDIEGKLKEYIKKASEIGIKESILMPVPMPVIKISNYKIIPVMLGTYKNEHFIVKGISDSKPIRGLLVDNNPYHFVNKILYQSISAHKNSNIKMHFIPLTHPLLDDIEYLEKLYYEYKPIAFKLHGYAGIFSPFEIKDEFWKFLHSHNIPIIVHTDCDTSNSKESIDTFYRNENSPLNWIKILNAHSIKAYLTHGVRLCEESFKLINSSSNLIVGLGPDALLSNCKDRMYSNSPYLKTLFSNIDINKICFDLDYPWNVPSYDDKALDWNSIDRINALNLKEEEVQKVLCNNSKKFFKL